MGELKKVRLSFENSKRITRQSLRIDRKIEELLYGGFGEDIKHVVSAINNAVYELAEKKGVSVYDICYHFMPEEKTIYPELGNMNDFKNARHTITKELRLIPMEFELEKGPGYWKGKYYALKRKMQELIDSKED